MTSGVSKVDDLSYHNNHVRTRLNSAISIKAYWNPPKEKQRGLGALAKKVEQQRVGPGPINHADVTTETKTYAEWEGLTINVVYSENRKGEFVC